VENGCEMEDRFTHIGWKNLIIVENGCEMGDRFP
jgi:hypothetical protein